MIDVIWGPHTCDRFASYYNAQLPVFNSRFASPGSSGVDALAQDWSGANNWLCPPVDLVVPVVRKLQSCRGRGTLIVPEWPSSMFWPFLRLSPLKFKPNVREVLQLPRISELSIEGPDQRATYRTKKSVFSSCPAVDILALRLDFAHQALRCLSGALELLPFLVLDLVNLQFGAKAPATLRKYRAGWLRLRSWALSKFGVPVIPAEPLHVAWFLTDLRNSARKNSVGFSSSEGAVYSIACVHRLAGFHLSPADQPFVKSTLEGARRSLEKPIRPKEPLSLELVQRVASHYMSNDTLAVIRFLFVLLVGYADFLRVDEILRMSISDISIFPEHMLVSLPKTKNDQFREGHSLYLITSDRITCPVAILEKLLSHLPKSDGSLPLVRRIVRSKSNERFHDSKGVSYSTIRDKFRKFLKPFVSDV
ncbi:uncharacterized protein [Montipora foliosa]|uniref:uncharacterized protein n=1 Tax=Montipora foliosa TaxID=591990 RepID=UPI0035F1BBE5